MEYSFVEHLSSLHINLFVIPKLIYGEPILTTEEIIEEMVLFFKYNGGLK